MGEATLELTLFDLIGLAIAATMIALLVGRAVANLRELARRSRRRHAADFVFAQIAVTQLALAGATV